MPVFKTEAIVLGRTDYSNSSQIVTFYTRNHGKIRTIAKGFKRSSGKRSPKAVDLLTHYQILFIKKEHSSLHILTDAILQNNYPPFRNDLDKYYKASCIAELLNEFTEEDASSGPLFDICLHALSGISIHADTIVPLLAFEIKMLKILGYLPELRHCVHCKNNIQYISRTYFSAKEGGVICNECQEMLKGGILVPVGAVLIARRLADFNIQRMDRVKIQSSICIEIEKMLRYYIVFILNKKLNSWKYMNLDENVLWVP
ncbi:MAG: DNA repair protein RecO [wastewater metagenome]|nr:DNA repair protein RecO [Candidatus Loosdrechtia aerotolerans]